MKLGLALYPPLVQNFEDPTHLDIVLGVCLGIALNKLVDLDKAVLVLLAIE